MFSISISPFRRFVETVPLLVAMGIASTAVGAVDGTPNERTVELGSLECEVLPETRRNNIYRSTAEVSCMFRQVNGVVEYYQGETGVRLGVDLSIKERDKLRFAVVSSHRVGEAPPAFILKGKFFGPSASAALTYGLGVAALIGGTKGEISLQPVGLETTRGLGISAGLGYLYLEPGQG